VKLDIGRVFNSVVELIRNNPLILAPQIAAAVLTFVLSLLLADTMVSTAGFVEGDWDSFVSSINWGALATFIALSIIIYVFAYGISLGMACDVLETGTASIGSGLSRFLGRLLHLIVAGILVGLIVAVGLVLCIIPGLIAGFFLMFTFVAIVYSERGAVEGISGSIEMAKSNVPDALLFLLIITGLSFTGSFIGNIFDIIPVIGGLISAILEGGISVFTTVLLVKVYAELLAPEPAAEPVI
jgi:hypothetical protein